MVPFRHSSSPLPAPPGLLQMPGVILSLDRWVIFSDTGPAGDGQKTQEAGALEPGCPRQSGPSPAGYILAPLTQHTARHQGPSGGTWPIARTPVCTAGLPAPLPEDQVAIWRGQLVLG